MPLPTEIQDALRVYDNNKGFWRRLFRRDQAAIRAIRRLSDADQTNFLKIYQCFIENLSKPSQESYKVYQALLTYLNRIDFSGIPDTMNELHHAKLLKPENIDKITHLKENHFQTLAMLLNQLSMNNLLTQANFDNISKHFETREGNISLEFSVIVNAVDLLRGQYLNQENLNSLLEKPMQAGNMASALKILDSNGLLTSSNRFKLHNDDNQFLLSDEAYSLVWHPLEAHLPKLPDDKKQSVFDRIIDLLQQENPKENIENFMSEELNSDSNKFRSRTNSENKPYRSRVNSANKFYTAPAQDQKSRGSIENLLSSSSLPKSGTL